jgi:uncharacterized protein YwgA
MRDAHKLLLLLKHHGPIRGRTRFQKLVFLLQEKYHIDFGYNFIPYYYGPYSRKLQMEIDWLAAHRLIEIQPRNHHYLSKLGEKSLQSVTPTHQIDIFTDAIHKMKQIPTSHLIQEAKSLIHL